MGYVTDNAGTMKWTPENDDVGIEVNKITSKNSPLMQQAQTTGLSTANRRGLLNSSMAVQAAQQATYNTALPIASQTAQQNSQRNTQQLSLDSSERTALADRTATSSARAVEYYNAAEANYQNAIAQLAQNSNLSASTRAEYLAALNKSRENSIKMLQQIYGVNITWPTMGT